MKRTIWVAALLLAAVGTILFVRSRRKPPAQYRTAKADRGDITMSVSATGTLSAVITVQVGSQVSGIIARLYADFNSRVKKGQLLAELDPVPFEQAVEQQKANLDKAKVDAANAKIALAREAKLKEDGLAAQADYDNAKATSDDDNALVALAQAALAQAETNLKYSKIISPVDGVVVNRAYDVGQTVAASFQAPTLFTIAQDLTKMQVEADTDESDIGRVHVGQPVRFTVDAFPDQVFHASVSQIRLNATVNQNVVTYPVMIAVANPDEKLKPSMTPSVTIDVATVKDVLRVPNAALRFKPAFSGGRTGAAAPPENSPKPAPADGLRKAARSAGPTVYVLDASGHLHPVPVHTGVSDGQMTEVVSGDLNEGDMVVTGLATSKAETSSAPRMRF